MFVGLYHLHSLNLPLPGAFIDLLRINYDSCLLVLMMAHDLESCSAAWMDSSMAACGVGRFVGRTLGLDDDGA